MSIRLEKEIKEIKHFLIEYAKKTHTDGYVLGISGGLDSSVLFRILEDTDLKVIAITMPIHSLEQDMAHAMLLTNGTNKTVINVDLTEVYDKMLDALPNTQNSLANSNIKPRLRMTTLYQVAQTNNLLVCGATNKSEYMTGYFTKHGDSGVDVMPLREFLKEEIFEMGKILNVPEAILKKPPSAGLFKGQTDEDEMGVTYETLDGILLGKKSDKIIEEKVKSMIERTAHKRNVPVFYKREEE